MSTSTRGVPVTRRKRKRKRKRRAPKPTPCSTCAQRKAAELERSKRWRRRRDALIVLACVFVLGLIMGGGRRAPSPRIRSARTLPGLAPAEHQADAAELTARKHALERTSERIPYAWR